MAITRFEDIEAWQMARGLSQQIYAMVYEGRAKVGALISYLEKSARRSAASLGANKTGNREPGTGNS